jgi:hypothetical protein
VGAGCSGSDRAGLAQHGVSGGHELVSSGDNALSGRCRIHGDIAAQMAPDLGAAGHGAGPGSVPTIVAGEEAPLENPTRISFAPWTT